LQPAAPLAAIADNELHNEADNEADDSLEQALEEIIEEGVGASLPTLSMMKLDFRTRSVRL